MPATITWVFNAITFQGRILPARSTWYPTAGDLALFENHLHARSLNVDTFMGNHPAVATFFGYGQGDAGPPTPPDVTDQQGSSGEPVGGAAGSGDAGGSGGGGAAEALPQTWPGWKQDVLSGLGAGASQQNLDYLQTWHDHEGSSASYNPLNTTQPASGATDYNSVHVKNYPSPTVGLRATIETLLNGYYPHIVAGLRSGGMRDYLQNPTNLAAVIRETGTWGTTTAFISTYAGSSGIGGSTGGSSGGGGSAGGSGGAGGSAGGGTGIGGAAEVTAGTLPSSLSVPTATAGAWRRLCRSFDRRLEQRDKIKVSVATIGRLVR